MSKSILIVLLAFLAAACSTKNISMQPSANLKTISKDISVNISGPNIDPTIVDKLTRELKDKLIIAGFVLANEPGKNINLNVTITDYSPGNAALRLIVSFGAGRGSLLYKAQYTDQSGQVLAKMEGNERFTGLEAFDYNQHYGQFATLGGEATVREVLVKEAAKHIVDLAFKE